MDCAESAFLANARGLDGDQKLSSNCAWPDAAHQCTNSGHRWAVGVSKMAGEARILDPLLIEIRATGVRKAKANLLFKLCKRDNSRHGCGRAAPSRTTRNCLD